MTEVRSYRLFDVVLVRKTILSPHMARLTFGGPAVREITTWAPDQRIKVFFPDPSGRPSALEDRPDWYALYKVRDVSDRPAMRTYTIRALRADEAEVDVDFVLHGETGPASRWAINAKPGDGVQITAPNRAFTGEGGGYEWKPPAEPGRVLLIGDETALPAVAGILEELAALPSPPPTQAFVEVPAAEDALDLPTWAGLELEWIARGDGDHGAAMIDAAQRARLPETALRAVEALPDVDIEATLPWDRAAPGTPGAFYGWVAGESSAVMAIRKHLIQERGLDRKSLNLMGYWRLGRVLD